MSRRIVTCENRIVEAEYVWGIIFLNIVLKNTLYNKKSLFNCCDYFYVLYLTGIDVELNFNYINYNIYENKYYTGCSQAK